MRSSSCASSTRSGARTSWLRHAGHTTSASTVGRIVSHLRQGGRLKEAPRGRVLARRGHLRRPYTVRKPPPRLPRPGSRRDSVQIDTLDVQILPVVRLKQFTAGDVISR